ncbi:MAG: D-alanyl-D-alanine carboxypeptidase, partial [Nitrososphaeria archaeon]
MEETLAYIFRDKKGNILTGKNPTFPMVPASNMKILTGFISSIVLGENYNIRTYFKVLNEKLIVSGGPCPLFRTSDAEMIKEKLSVFKIKKVLFRPSLDEDYYAPGWPSSDQKECYQARITSFSINENCIPICKSIQNSCKNDPHTGKGISDIRPYDTFSRHLVSDVAKDIFRSYEFTNSTGGRLIYTHQERIGDILTHLETISCNFSADSLFKFLPSFKTGDRGSWKGGSEVIFQELKRLNLLEQGVQIVDGSGLSHLNKVTPSMLSNLIRAAIKKDDGTFLQHLPSPGEGTLKNRLKEFTDYGLKAKTGTLKGVASLSGYIKKLDVTFSI